MTLDLSKLLENIVLPEQGSSARIFHGRGHYYSGLEHLNIDLFSNVLVLTSYKEVASEQYDELVQALLKALPTCTAIALQQREQPLAPITWLWGEPQSHLVITEAGIKYGIQIGERQNLGFFPDMSNGRLWLKESAKDKRVLNLFAYTCAFSVAAIEGGAQSVVNLDMSSASLSQGRHNHKLNQHDLSKVKFFAHDLFKSWGKLKRLGPYDIIVIDPPSLQKGSFDARKDYAKVIKRLPDLLNEGGQALICLNAPELSFAFLESLVKEHAPNLNLEQRLPTAEVFKESEADKGLKTLIYKK